jgi:hypothetical protein
VLHQKQNSKPGNVGAVRAEQLVAREMQIGVSDNDKKERLGKTVDRRRNSRQKTDQSVSQPEATDVAEGTSK